MYAPQTPQLHAVREHIAANVKQLRAIVESPGFRRRVGALEGERLQRVPRGFPKDHPAAEYLKYRQFLAGARTPAGRSPPARGSMATLLDVFRQVVPLVRFLNEPLLPASDEHRRHAVQQGTARGVRWDRDRLRHAGSG